MTNQEIITALKVHADVNIECDDCPLNNTLMCFERLVEETIAKLEQQEGDQVRFYLGSFIRR